MTKGPIRVTGSIRTDDVTGPLTIGDISSWNITATAPGIAIEFTPEDSGLFVLGNDLVSTGSEITFAYGSDDGGLFGFFEPVDGGSFPNGFPILCNATAGQNGLGCTQSGVTLGDPPNQVFAPVTQTVVIGETPEPATWAMMLLGFAGLGFMGWRKRDA